MHIESLTIQGFKSYRDATSVEHFSPGVNVVVGRNGSGKSNFFSAIRFLLNDQYGSLTREDRQSLLHEGSDNNSTFSAFVEAVFDNSDQRFPTGKNQVIIRRTDNRIWICQLHSVSASSSIRILVASAFITERFVDILL
ncbi:hypothetical protein MJO28_011891 [Puccinia striiformis f. sp. tritici]|uniref:Uncharacterized protein n=1 Tax=Puccinia striiformis f. sp. tritici TaxID=168172 RepID=A0ACC0E6G3_9BASI|nr:hypothetical protein MJO28_011891 [Puccinia striiformis f. sp. tritici]